MRKMQLEEALLEISFFHQIQSYLNLARKEKESTGAQEVKDSAAFSKFLQAVSFNYSQVMGIISDISYIGPIRDNPHRFYEIGNQNYNTVGHRGQNTINLLNRNISTIQEQLNEWVKRFEFGDNVELKSLSKSIRSIVFNNKSSRTYTNLANSGFGAS